MTPFDPKGELPESGVTLLEASAGTGKTYSIAGLCVRLIVETDVRPDRLLVVTFGKAATSELRDRVRIRLRDARDALGAALDGAALGGAAPEPKDPAIARLLEQATDAATRRLWHARACEAVERFDDVTISTIHGFCARVLRDHAFACGAELDTELLGDPRELLDEIVRDFWDARVATLPVESLRTLREDEKLDPTTLLEVARKATRDHDAPIEPAGTADGHDAPSLKRACASFARRELAARLRAAHRLTYDDLLRSVRDALDDPARGNSLRAALRDAYDVVLIDEFQDTDAVQWAIFGSTFAEPPHRLVLIGDPKQAIYGFRGADVHTYLHAADTAGVRQSLPRNWRSDRPYVEAINHLFANHPQPFAVPGIRYERVDAQQEVRLTDDDGAPFVVRLLRRGEPHLPPSKRPAGGPPTKEAVERQIPSLVAADVVRFLRSGARIDGRPVEPSDVAVLVRKNRQAVDVQQALRAAGVPSVLRTSESVFATGEAADLATVLDAVLEPSSASRLRAALATDLLGLAAATELSADGQIVGSGDVLARLEIDDEAVDRWHERFRAWRDRWEGTGRGGAAGGIAVLARAIVSELSLPERLLAYTDGERRLTNLLHLAELLHAEETERAMEPGRLLLWLREQIDDPLPEDETRQMRLETDVTAAQIVTIHASKGLEYPVVWCPYLWDGALAQKNDKKHPYYRTASGTRAIHVAPDGKGEECERLDDESFEESLRLLYVALTRARHRCTVWWGAVSGGGTSALGWLLHGTDAPDSRTARRKCLDALKNASDQAVLDRLAQIGRGSGGTIAVVPETFDPPGRWAAANEELPTLGARPYTRRGALADGWRYGSFTALTRRAAARYGGGIELPEAVEDAREEGTSVPNEDAGTSVPLAEFPASATAGVFFHDVLEHHDLAGDDEALVGLVRERLESFDFDGARWAEPVAAALRDVLHAPIDTGGTMLRLRDIPRERRLAELRFELPACGGFDGASGTVTPAALAAAFRDHPGGKLDGETLASYADRVARLGFSPLRGFLTGAIDLTVEHEGQWWVIDWKSNRLGVQRDDYAPDRLLDEMTEAHYVLQYHLYLVAMHRWLGARLLEYDYDTHVGGACYPFLRGVVPDGGVSGVFVDRPPKARIEALDRLLREGA